MSDNENSSEMFQNNPKFSCKHVFTSLDKTCGVRKLEWIFSGSYLRKLRETDLSLRRILRRT